MDRGDGWVDVETGQTHFDLPLTDIAEGTVDGTTHTLSGGRSTTRRPSAAEGSVNDTARTLSGGRSTTRRPSAAEGTVDGTARTLSVGGIG